MVGEQDETGEVRELVSAARAAAMRRSSRLVLPIGAFDGLGINDRR